MELPHFYYACWGMERAIRLLRFMAKNQYKTEATMQRRLHTFTSMFFRQCRAGATLSPVAAVSKALQVTGCDEGSHSAGKDYDVQILPIDQSTYDQSGMSGIHCFMLS